jgi:exopolysaccharide production protein ExoZ
MAVLFFHVERELFSARPGAFGSLFVDFAWLGQVGVDIFFVISGFIMYFVHRGDFARPGMVKRFFLRRLVRVVPTYWLLTTLTVVGLVLLPGLFNSRTTDWGWITASYLFVPWQSPAGDISPPVGPGWTLNYEMYFYVIFGSLLLMPRRVALPV